MLEWISYHVEKNKYDASAIDFSCCNMDGYTLCQYTRDQLGIIFGPLGDKLYDNLHEISKCRVLLQATMKEQESLDGMPWLILLTGTVSVELIGAEKTTHWRLCPLLFLTPLCVF